MRSRPLLFCTLVSWIPVAALAVGAPFATPPELDVPLGPPEIAAPPEAPPVAAPPIDLVLPQPPDARPDVDVPQGPPEAPQGPPDVPQGLPEVPQGRPDPLPSADHPVAPPDLIGVVDLPDAAADVVLGLAPPFGGELGGGHASGQVFFRVALVPEPTTALLLMLGLVGFAARRR